ncbi:MAG: rRNA maturation RNase YbeY [Bacteroidota bacterium]
MINYTYLPNTNIKNLVGLICSNWLKEVIVCEDKKLGDIQFIFCDDDYLHSINTTYLNHDTLTDIITFSTSENEKIISGEIYISVNRVRDNSSIHSTSFDNELSRVMVHGILHLIGYDDHNPSDKKIMRSKEDYYLLLQAGLN